MNPAITIIFILLTLAVIGWFMVRSIRKQVKKVLDGERSMDDKDIWLRYAKPLPAIVISKKETINPKAGGIAKVDLELEIQIPEGIPIRATTCWLVETPSLAELEVGNIVEVKFDPKKPKRVFPAVPWARVWLFGK